MNKITIFNDASSFELAQRQAKALSQSTLIPDAFRDNIPNCLIALELSHRLDLSPLVVFQSLYVVGGKPAFNSSFIIAQINASGKFAGPLQFNFTGEGDKLACIAYATDHNGENQTGPQVSIAMAKGEGWYSRKGSKWQTMPDLMLRYRAAAFFGRVFTPELLLGMHTTEELKDINDTATVISKESRKEQVTPKTNEQTFDAQKQAADFKKWEEESKQKWPTVGSQKRVEDTSK